MFTCTRTFSANILKCSLKSDKKPVWNRIWELNMLRCAFGLIRSQSQISYLPEAFFLPLTLHRNDEKYSELRFEFRANFFHFQHHKIMIKISKMLISHKSQFFKWRILDHMMKWILWWVTWLVLTFDKNKQGHPKTSLKQTVSW